MLRAISLRSSSGALMLSSSGAPSSHVMVRSRFVESSGNGTGTETPAPTEPAPPTPVVRHSRRSSCQVALEGPSELSADEAVLLKGRLTCAEAGVAAGQQISIFERTAGAFAKAVEFQRAR